MPLYKEEAEAQRVRMASPKAHGEFMSWKSNFMRIFQGLGTSEDHPTNNERAEDRMKKDLVVERGRSSKIYRREGRRLD